MKTANRVSIIFFIVYSLCSIAKSKSIALVIGNENFDNTVNLTTPINDAIDIKNVLYGNFNTIITVIDKKKSAIDQAIQNFALKAKDAETCLFYYSGHGIEINGNNYLYPSDGEIANKGDLTNKLIPLSKILKLLQQSKAKRKIIILDCCRDNPLIRDHNSTGLAAVSDDQLPYGTIITYAGSPGMSVPDGGIEERNSPFTAELIKHLKPNRKLVDILSSIAVGRYKKQDPWINYNGSLKSHSDLMNYKPITKSNHKQNTSKLTHAKMVSTWNHNGSIMGLLSEGKKRSIIYLKVRPAMKNRVQSGAVLFNGVVNGKALSGVARRFSPGLKPNEYKVKGTFSRDSKKIKLKGRVRLRGQDGKYKKTINDTLEFHAL